jgi:ABC-type uncharacterized transport system substrate-binding protein
MGNSALELANSQYVISDSRGTTRRSQEIAMVKNHAPRALALAAGLAALVGAAPALAHPHIWVTTEVTVLFEGGSISGFRHKWTFDELYTSMAVQDLDTNKDGKYSREELAELAKVNIDGLKEFQFFTHARLGGARLDLAEPKDYWLEHGDAPFDPEAAKLPQQEMLPRASEVGKQGFFSRLWDLIAGTSKPDPKEAAPPKVLSLHFTVPFRQPVLADAPEFNFAIYDSSFFIAFEMAKREPLKLGAGAPADCRFIVGEAERAADDAQRLGEQFAKELGAQNFGMLAAKPIRLQCGPRS